MGIEVILKKDIPKGHESEYIDLSKIDAFSFICGFDKGDNHEPKPKKGCLH